MLAMSKALCDSIIASGSFSRDNKIVKKYESVCEKGLLDTLKKWKKNEDDNLASR